MIVDVMRTTDWVLRLNLMMTKGRECRKEQIYEVVDKAVQSDGREDW